MESNNAWLRHISQLFFLAFLLYYLKDSLAILLRYSLVERSYKDTGHRLGPSLQLFFVPFAASGDSGAYWPATTEVSLVCHGPREKGSFSMCLPRWRKREGKCCDKRVEITAVMEVSVIFVQSKM
jgi:hypothetical protein